MGFELCIGEVEKSPCLRSAQGDDPGHNLKAKDEEELAHEVDEGGMDGESVHVWVESSFPEEIRENLRDKQRNNDLLHPIRIRYSQAEG